MDTLEPRNSLARRMTLGVGAAAGGITLLILAALSRGIAGVVVGGAVALLGSAISGSKKDRTPGLIVAGVGIVAAVSSLSRILPILPNLGWLMSLSGAGLLAGGIVALVRSIGSLRKRM
jgi:hypothetical protein